MKIENILAFHSDKLFGTKYIVHHAHCAWEPYKDELCIMERDGKAIAWVYWYKEDTRKVYLYSLSVVPESRRNRIGTELQIIREKIGVLLGATESVLWVDKDTWMLKWYKRRGYIEFTNALEPDANTVWMKKSLNKYYEARRNNNHRRRKTPRSYQR